MKLFQFLLLASLSFAAARLQGAKELDQENPSENIVGENPSNADDRDLTLFESSPANGEDPPENNVDKNPSNGDRDLVFFGSNPRTGAAVAACPGGCNQALATSFCLSQGYAGATTWEAFPNNLGFRYINCVGPVPPPPPPPPPRCTITPFGWSHVTGFPYAYCNPVTGCTKAQADGFCQSQGYDAATTWQAFPQPLPFNPGFWHYWHFHGYPYGWPHGYHHGPYLAYHYINCIKCVY